jgi:hypothetical protein
MTVSFRPAKREQIPLLLGVAGGTGSGKTLSALRMARGIAEGGPFAFVDTENGRGLHYADQFPEMQHGDLRAPFRPDAYTDAIQDGFAHLKDVPKERRVVVVDSFSHEWTGDGGCLDWVDEITNGDPKRNPQAWAKVKPAHRKMMTRLLGLDAHVILCLRAEYGKMDIIRKDGKTEFVPKRTLPGGSLDGWTILSEKDVPYELTASFLVISDAPGIPRPLKLQEQHKQFVPLDQPLSEQTGKQLAAWAAGSSGEPNDPVSGHDEQQPGQATETAPSKVVPPPDSGVEVASPDDEITALTLELINGSKDPAEAAKEVERHRLTEHAEDHLAWLLAWKAARGGDAA